MLYFQIKFKIRICVKWGITIFFNHKMNTTYPISLQIPYLPHLDCCFIWPQHHFIRFHRNISLKFLNMTYFYQKLDVLFVICNTNGDKKKIYFYRMKPFWIFIIILCFTITRISCIFVLKTNSIIFHWNRWNVMTMDNFSELHSYFGKIMKLVCHVRLLSPGNKMQ